MKRFKIEFSQCPSLVIPEGTLVKVVYIRPDFCRVLSDVPITKNGLKSIYMTADDVDTFLEDSD